MRCKIAGPETQQDVSDENRPQHRELRPLLFSNSASTLPLSKALYLGGEKTNLVGTLFQYFEVLRYLVAMQLQPKLKLYAAIVYTESV